jgi:hypothetical protein
LVTSGSGSLDNSSNVSSVNTSARTKVCHHITTTTTTRQQSTYPRTEQKSLEAEVTQITHNISVVCP